MKKLAVLFWLATALLSTVVSIPMIQYREATILYGSQFLDANFILEYIQMWWQKLIRRLTGQYGTAETTSPSPQEAQTYTLPSTKTKITQPTNIYELVAHLKQNQLEYSAKILDYIQANGIPNKSAQIDLFIVPEKIYLTFYWDTTKLAIHDGWGGDLNAQEYIVATATSSFVMTLYENQDPSVLRSQILQAEGNGELSYVINRLNPETTLPLTIIETISSLLAVIGWSLIIYHYSIRGKR